MEFRPCIDIHNGTVKQIVGGSLSDKNNKAKANFVSKFDAAFYANLYKSRGIKGGHIILLNAKDSIYYEATKVQALNALRAYPNGLQIGGGISADNAEAFIRAGATQVIVTSYVFRDGEIRLDNLRELVRAIGREHICLDLSCRKKGDSYVVVTDRWQNETKEALSRNLLESLHEYCSEFLVHAIDVEGRRNGIEEKVVEILGSFSKCPVTYAGGIRNEEDLMRVKELGMGRVNFTVGSALDIFGGELPFEKVVDFGKQ